MSRWGFLGTGRVTHRMAEAISAIPEACVAGIASRDRSRAKAWRAKLEPDQSAKVHVFESYESLVEDPSMDWIYVALPPSMHRTWSEKALLAGRHVLCEKPLTTSFEDSQALANLAAAQQRILVEATAFPFHPRSTAARMVVQSGELGQLRRIHAACSFSQIWDRESDHRMEAAMGGGCLLDLGWYCVYMTLWLTKLTCHAVHAIGEQRLGVWNHVQVLAEMSGGVIAHWDCGFDAANRKWIEIAGSNASWICDDLPRPWDLAKPRFWVHGQQGKTRVEEHGPNTFQEAELIRECSRATWLSTESTSGLAERLALALQTQRILDSIQQSAITRSTVHIVG
jgi:dTDP-3,4-didehydro-2,6-dideoxy-alpha-D-glucose 3-reductase